MILYFSGTGNSRFTAKRIAQTTGDEVVSLNRLLKQNIQTVLVSKTQPFVFVCPTYAWRLPRIVDELIRNLSFKGNKNVYFVLTCGGETANAIHYIKKLCTYKGWNLQGFAEVLMPDNYIVMFPSLKEDAVKRLLRKSDTVIQQIAEDIHQEKQFFTYISNGFSGKLQSGFVNNLFYPIFVNAKGFYITERKCIHCGKCAKLCSLNNITMVDGNPVWGDHCTHCMACICGCPKDAIEYKNKSQGKLRYFLK